MVDNLYVDFSQKCELISLGNIPDWKNNITVHHMLEHVQGNDAKIFLEKLVEEGINIDDIQRYCFMVDAIGCPSVYEYNVSGRKIVSSPTCIRYLYYANEIFKHLPFMNDFSLAEIGAGYGGSIVALDFIIKLKGYSKNLKYHVLDIPQVQLLQAFYLKHFDISLSVIFEDCFQHGKNLENIFVISNYCISEIGDDNRNSYFSNLIIPKCIGGYFVWNSGASIDPISNNFLITSIKDESPKTGPLNKVIIFSKQ